MKIGRKEYFYFGFKERKQSSSESGKSKQIAFVEKRERKVFDLSSI